MKHLSWIALDWAVRCFGREHVYNVKVRSLRVAEEAIELLQALDIPREQTHKLVDMVFDRPKGDIQQELQGVVMTTSVLASSLGYGTDDLLYEEIRRVLAFPPEKFAKRNEEKIQLGMDAK